MADQRVEDTTAAGEDQVAPYLVTVGVPLGLTIDPQTNQRQGMVRHGRDLLNMDLDAYWVLFRATYPVSRDALANWATSNGRAADPERVIDRCLDAGLLISMVAGTHPDELWPKLRLQPIGKGNGPDNAGRCEIVLPEGKKAEVDGFAYTFWAASDGRSIQEVAEFLATELKMDRESAIILVPLTLFRLLRQGAAYLDKAP